MSKSLCAFNHLLAEELQGTAALRLEIKNCAGFARRGGWHARCGGARGRGAERHPGRQGAVGRECCGGIVTRRG